MTLAANFPIRYMVIESHDKDGFIERVETSLVSLSSRLGISIPEQVVIVFLPLCCGDVYIYHQVMVR